MGAQKHSHVQASCFMQPSGVGRSTRHLHAPEACACPWSLHGTSRFRASEGFGLVGLAGSRRLDRTPNKNYTQGRTRCNLPVPLVQGPSKAFPGANEALAGAPADSRPATAPTASRARRMMKEDLMVVYWSDQMNEQGLRMKNASGSRLGRHAGGVHA